MALASKRNSDRYIDLGATHHVTTNLSSLSIQENYSTLEQRAISDGSALPIISSSSFTLYTPSHMSELNNILCAPQISIN